MVLICSEQIPHGVSLPWVRRWWPWHPPLTPKFDLEKPPIIKQLQSHHMLILWGVLVVAWWGWSFCLVLESHACCWSFLDQICFGSHLHYCRAKGGLPPLSGLFCSLIPFDHREIPVKAPRHGDWWKGFHEPCISDHRQHGGAPRLSCPCGKEVICLGVKGSGP